MRTSIIAAACLATGLGAIATTAAANPSPHDEDPNLINVSCYRGWVNAVAWDRANSVFIQDLMQIGYTYEKATAIAEHICRDEFGVRNPSHQIEQLRRVLREDPPR